MVHSSSQKHLTPEQQQLILASRVVICIPCYGGMISGKTSRSMLHCAGFWTECGLDWQLETLSNDALVSRARNRLAGRMMARPHATHLLFVDADIGFATSDLVRMIAHDLDFVAGLYPKKAYPIEYPVSGLPNTLPRNEEVVEVVEIGTGFVLLKRIVLERMMENHSDLHCAGDDETPQPERPFHYTLFDTSIEKGTYYSEDFTFCRRWRALGGQIFADLRIKLSHSGGHTFEGDPQAHLQFAD